MSYGLKADTPDLDAVRKGQRLIEVWENALRHREVSKALLIQATKELDDAVEDLAKWILPEDAKVRESFHIWVGGGLLAGRLERIEPLSYTMEWRLRPKYG